MPVGHISVKPEILKWVVQRTGQTIEEYTKKHADFSKWLDGEKTPTLKQLEVFAKKCYIPMGCLFLDKPQPDVCPIPVFRAKATKASINVIDLIKDISSRQEWLSSYLSSNGIDTPDYVGKFAQEQCPQVVCDAVRDILNLPDDWAEGIRKVEDALRVLTLRIENSGTMVSFNSLVGNHTNRHIDVAECRGFALIDKNAPFVFVNSGDAKVAQVFTLIHEFAHILTGYSAGIGEIEHINAYSEQEKFCDKVAALFLLPENSFREKWNGDNEENYVMLTRRFKVSRYTIARRAQELSLISKEKMFSRFKEWDNEPHDQKAGRGGVVKFPVLALKRNSPTFMIHLNNALNDNQILHLDAYRLAGLKGDTYHKVITSPEFTKM